MQPLFLNSDSSSLDSMARTWCEIDLRALKSNFSILTSQLPHGGKLIISAKKEAYGHGLSEVASTLQLEPRLGAVGLATIEEALVLRKRFQQLPIISFGVLSGEALAEAVRAGIILTITDLADARAASEIAQELGVEARAHFKLDTGMGRLGRLTQEVSDQIPAILALPKLKIEAVYSHLADAWHNQASGLEQWNQLESFRNQTGLTDLPLHWGGSDALGMLNIMAPGTWLRTGIALYGDHPALPELEPVMTFKTRVIYRRTVPKGTTVSYGMTFTTQRSSELAVVGAGYGNGYPRILGNRSEVLIAGKRRPILGRVCMDQFVVDVTDAPNVSVGDEVVLFGKQGPALLPAAEVAQAAGTISYELFCLAGGMNPRFYLPSPA